MQIKLTEQKLKEASALVRCTMLQALPDEEEEVFSSAFEERICKLRAAQHKREKGSYIRKRLVAAVIVLVLLLATVVSFNTEVRATVVTWFKQVFETYSKYWFTGDAVDTLPNYIITDLPEGYKVIIEDVISNRKAYIYQRGDDTEDVFSFEYGKLGDDSPLTIQFPTDEFQTFQVTVNGLPGDLYLSDISEESHGLIWIDDAKGLYFLITAYFDGDRIMDIANSIEEK